MSICGVKEFMVRLVEYERYVKIVVIWILNLLKSLFMIGVMRYIVFIMIEEIYVVIGKRRLLSVIKRV